MAEIIHCFPASNDPQQNNGMDLDIQLARNSSWFINQWQLAVLYPEREVRAKVVAEAYVVRVACMCVCVCLCLCVRAHVCVC